MSDVRLIDANVLPNYKCQVTATIGDRKGPAEIRFVFWQDIEKAPTISAVPVVHGRWDTSSDIPDTLICSVCGRKFDMYFFDSKDMPYCLCGAKMDGGAEND